MDASGYAIIPQECTYRWHYRPHRPLPPPLPVAPPGRTTVIDPCILSAVERDILWYSFRDLGLLEEALIHPSCVGSPSNYERLEFLGDSALGLAVTNHLYESYPELDPGQLSLLKAANISTEKLARAALRSGLYRCFRHNTATLDDKVREFAEAVKREENTVVHGGTVKAPKVLADVVESVAAAVYVDVNLNLKRLWVIFRHILEPIVTLDELRHQPQPVSMLYELCQKNGKTVNISHWMDGEKHIARVCVDGKFIASGSSEHREIAKLDAAKLALAKFADPKPAREREGAIGSPERVKKKLHRERKNFPSIFGVEEILGYEFRNRRLLEEALTHSSYDENSSYERLEFVGDAVLELALTNYVYSAYPKADQGQLSLLRAANISTEKFARVALYHGLYWFMRHSLAALDDKVQKFAKAVEEDGDAAVYGGSVKAPKVLADIAESVAAAIYVDIGFDLEQLWVIFRSLLEPVVTLEVLQHQPQPVTLLYELCQKKGKTVHFQNWKKHSRNITSVFVDGKFVASGSSRMKETAKLNAAKSALMKLSELEHLNRGEVEIPDWIDGPFEIEGAKQKLLELCGKKKWSYPTYSREKEMGPTNDKKFICSVKIPTSEGVLCMMGDEKNRIKDAENSAASLMIRALYESNLLS
ncbi:hypothetical protein CRG98_033555 [Punica granatum]|uniref:Uncharacterized protein n=1 Tax=Punica granatum TaxID=22663 RepID=A0A2I0IPW9_PUNGR|nr:hypothetical protein CRG98_033555 [Punica granatum]